MEAIARRARASKETLYAWFQNKETLLNILFSERLDGLASRTTAAAGLDPSPARLLPIIAEEVIRFMLVMEPLIQAIGVSEAGDKAQRMLGETIAAEAGPLRRLPGAGARKRRDRFRRRSVRAHLAVRGDGPGRNGACVPSAPAC